MIIKISTMSLIFGMISLGASTTPLDNEETKSPDLNARGGLCCALSENNKFIQPVCQYMYENCGGWEACVRGTEDDWCRHCVVEHPEDSACLTSTWPPGGRAPINKHGLNATTLSQRENLDSAKDEASSGVGQVEKRAIQYVQTQALVNVAQSFAKVFGLVTIRIIVSATNVVTYSVQNSGAEAVAWEIYNLVTGWAVNGNVGSGSLVGEYARSQAEAKGGDRFELDVI